jgi:methylated-DNA-[protein]-cysteine S-methyltransferase
MKTNQYENNQLYSRVCPGPFDSVIIVWSPGHHSPGIIQVLLSHPDTPAEQKLARFFPGATDRSCPEIDALGDMITDYFNGKDIRFPLAPILLDRCSSFQQAVLQAEYKIPRGSVSTYQRIARHLGKENGARAVGNALARNPFPLIIPCHRAVRSDGAPGGFQGGEAMKRTLLEMEGVRFNNRGYIVTENFYY